MGNGEWDLVGGEKPVQEDQEKEYFQLYLAPKRLGIIYMTHHPLQVRALVSTLGVSS